MTLLDSDDPRTGYLVDRRLGALRAAWAPMTAPSPARCGDGDGLPGVVPRQRPSKRWH